MYDYFMDISASEAYVPNIEIENQAYQYIIWKMLAILSSQ